MMMPVTSRSVSTRVLFASSTSPSSARTANGNSCATFGRLVRPVKADRTCRPVVHHTVLVPLSLLSDAHTEESQWSHTHRVDEAEVEQCLLHGCLSCGVLRLLWPTAQADDGQCAPLHNSLSAANNGNRTRNMLFSIIGPTRVPSIDYGPPSGRSNYSILM